MSIPTFTILVSILLFIIYVNVNKKEQKSISIKLLEKFNMNFFREKKLRKEKIFAKFSESLVLDPSINIEIHKWDEDNVLLEKASIHRARLTRYGKSKMNGTMYYLGPKGGVYLLTPKGNRKYV